MHPEGTSHRASWPYVEGKSYLWTWLFLVPLVAYTLWQILYFLIVNVLRRQRLLRDPEVMTSYRWSTLSLSLSLKVSIHFSSDFLVLQGTLKKSTESKQSLVALKWLAWGSKSHVHVHFVPSLIYCSNHGTYSPHLLVI